MKSVRHSTSLLLALLLANASGAQQESLLPRLRAIRPHADSPSSWCHLPGPERITNVLSEFMLRGDVEDHLASSFPRATRGGIRADLSVAPDASMFCSVPLDVDGFWSVFEQAPTGADLERIHDAVGAFGKSMSDSTLRSKAASDLGAEGFAQHLKDTSSEIVLVVGHNVNGDFRFVTGETRPIAEMADMCRNEGKVGVFLSCRSDSWIPHELHIGVQSDINFQECLAVVDGLSRSLANARSAERRVSLEELAAEVQMHLAGSRAQRNVRYLVEAGEKGAIASGLLVGACQVLEYSHPSRFEAEEAGYEAEGFLARLVEERLKYEADSVAQGGLLVLALIDGGQAESLGIRQGDILLTQDGRHLATREDLHTDPSEHTLSEDPVTFTLLRQDSRFSVVADPGLLGVFVQSIDDFLLERGSAGKHLRQQLETARVSRDRDIWDAAALLRLIKLRDARLDVTDQELALELVTEADADADRTQARREFETAVGRLVAP